MPTMPPEKSPRGYLSKAITSSRESNPTPLLTNLTSPRDQYGEDDRGSMDRRSHSKPCSTRPPEFNRRQVWFTANKTSSSATSFVISCGGQRDDSHGSSQSCTRHAEHACSCLPTQPSAPRTSSGSTAYASRLSIPLNKQSVRSAPSPITSG